MSLPSDETNHCSSRLKLRLLSARVMPATPRSSESTFSSRAMFRSTEIEKGSIAWGVVHSAVTDFSGARRTSCCFTRAEARATSTEREASLAHDARIGVGGPAHCGDVQSPVGNLLHAEIQIYHGDAESRRKSSK